MTSPVDEGRLLPRQTAVPMPEPEPRGDTRPAPPVAKRPEKRRLYVLDGLRLAAALMVVAYHYLGYNRWYPWGRNNGAIFPSAHRLAVYGWLGVYLFFLISGFVICMSCWGRTPRPYVLLVGLAAVMLLAAYLIQRLIEQPSARRLKDWLSPVRAAAVRPPSPSA